MKKLNLLLLMLTATISVSAQTASSLRDVLDQAPQLNGVEYFDGYGAVSQLDQYKPWAEWVAQFEAFVQSRRESAIKTLMIDKRVKMTAAEEKKMNDYGRALEAAAGISMEKMSEAEMMKFVNMSTTEIIAYYENAIRKKGKTPPSRAQYGVTDEILAKASAMNEQEKADMGLYDEDETTEEYVTLADKREKITAPLEDMMIDGYYAMQKVERPDEEAIQAQIAKWCEEYTIGKRFPDCNPKEFNDADWDVIKPKADSLRKAEEDAYHNRLYTVWQREVVAPGMKLLKEYADVFDADFSKEFKPNASSRDIAEMTVDAFINGELTIVRRTVADIIFHAHVRDVERDEKPLAIKLKELQ